MEGRAAALESRGTLPGTPADMPTAIEDNNFMEVDSDSDESDDIQEDIARFREERKATRTLYQYRREDDDTL